MGQEEIKRKQLTNIIKKVLETNIELMTYYKHYASDEKSKRVCSKSIRQTRKSLEKLPHIKHIEILQSLFNAIVGGKEVIFVSAGSLINSKNVEKWDTTNKGFKEFLQLEEQEREAKRKEFEEHQKQQKMMEQAKKDGKKVEMVFDPTTKKVKPVIVEDTTTHWYNVGVNG